MPNRTTKFVSAIIASFITAALFTSMSYGATAAADNCLAGPKKDAAQGSHWYYRIEHPSNRHCWYQRGEPAAASNATAPSGSPSPSTVSAMPGSVANARAELITPPVHGDRNLDIVTGQVPAAATGPVAAIDTSAPAKASDTSLLRSVVASRWPDQLAANMPVASAPADRADAGAPSNGVNAEPSAAASIALKAADVPPAKQSSSTQMLIIAVIGALSVAGLVASAVGFGGWGKKRPWPIEGERHATFETTHLEGPRPLPFPERPLPFPAASRPHIGIPKELREAEDPDDKIAEMLVRLARSAQA